MQSGDRVLASLNLKEPDLALVDFGGTNFTRIQVTAYDGPKRLLGVVTPTMILAAVHNIRPEAPPEDPVAFYDTTWEYGRATHCPTQ